MVKVPDHPCKILIIRGSGPGKTTALLNLINYHPGTDKIYLYVKDPSETKYQFLINKGGVADFREYDDFKAFIEYWSDLDNIYENLYIQSKKTCRLILFVSFFLHFQMNTSYEN